MSAQTAMLAATSPNSLLGFGFDIYQRLNLAHGTTSSVILSDDNISRSPPHDPSTSSVQEFQTRADAMRSFSSSVSAGFSGLAFSAEFNATYGTMSSCDDRTVYGLYDLLAPTAITKLNDIGPGKRAPGFADDVDVRSLPTQFTPATQEQFFRIFRRFGTHFVTEITLGGRLRAYTTAQTSQSLSSTDAFASMKMEYDGLFASGSLAASAAWKNVDQSWSSKRRVQAEALGGEKDVMAKISTAYGVDNSAVLAAWIASVPASPEIADFGLARLSRAFDGETATAVDRAIEAYLNGCAVIESPIPGGGTPNNVAHITLPGFPTQMKPADGDWQRNFLWLMLFDASDRLDPAAALLNQVYKYVTEAPVIEADIAAARANGRKLLVIACGSMYGPDGPFVPLPNAVDLLFRDCGTSAAALQQVVGLEIAFTMIGSTDGANPPALAFSSLSDVAQPSRTVANITAQPLVLVEQSGGTWDPPQKSCILSPG